MGEEADNRHATDETKKLIEKALARQRIEIFAQFNEILMRVTLNSGESLMRPHSDKINPFKVKMNLDIPNLEGNIDVESVDNWVQQIESFYALNQLFEVENITIASLKMSTSVHCWLEYILTKMEKDEEPIDKWEIFVE